MFESVVLPAIVSLVTALTVLWFKSFLGQREQRTLELQNRTRDSFQHLLDWHSELFISMHIKHESTMMETEDRVRVAKKLCMWASDDVVYHYARSFQALAPDKQPALNEYESELGEAILAFRKNELKFKNKRLTPEHIMI
jgi:hypothetical protein